MLSEAVIIELEPFVMQPVRAHTQNKHTGVVTVF